MRYGKTIYFKSKRNFALVVCGLMVAGMALFTGVLYIFAKLFEYSIWRLFAVDVPWYLDVIGGFISSECIWVVSLILYILELAGYPTPLFHKGN